VADDYLAEYFNRYPDQVTYFGVPGRHHDQLPDNSLATQKEWENREDAWLVRVRTLDASKMKPRRFVPPTRSSVKRSRARLAPVCAAPNSGTSVK